jgi:hypothetical protein
MILPPKLVVRDEKTKKYETELFDLLKKKVTSVSERRLPPNFVAG